jgi:hypothetical protein
VAILRGCRLRHAEALVREVTSVRRLIQRGEETKVTPLDSCRHAVGPNFTRGLM